MSVTEADREKAHELVGRHVRPKYFGETLARSVAAALAEEREKARAPFLLLNPMAYCNTQSGNGDAWDRGWVNAMQFITDELRRATEDS